MAQVAARILGVPLDYIKIKPTNTLIGPNDMTTGGSITSELCCLVRRNPLRCMTMLCNPTSQGALRACNELNERIAPVKTANPNASWKDLVKACYDEGVNLSVENL